MVPLLFQLALAAEPSGARAAQELRQFVDYLEAVHPEPHRFVTPEALHAEVDTQAAWLAGLDAPTPFEVGRAWHRVLAHVADSHVKVGLPLYGSDAPVSLLPVLPLTVHTTTFIDAASVELPLGTEVEHIDGRSMATIQEDLTPLVIAEGTTERVRQRALASDFARYYHLAYGMADTYVVGLRFPDGTTEDRPLPGVDRVGMQQLQRTRHSGPTRGPGTEDGAWPTVTRLDDHRALLSLPSFGAADMDTFRTRADAALADLEGIDTLYIDVRGNIGGLRPNAFAVLDHLIDQPYPQWDGFDARVTRIPRRHRKRVTFPMGGSPKERLPARPITGDPLLDWMSPRPTPFTGKVVVLVDGLTNSAANTFVLALVRYRPEVLVVGQELGGECGQHIGEFPAVYQPPSASVAVMHSLIRVDHIDVEGCTWGRGLRPHTPIDYTADDFLTGRAPWLSGAMDPGSTAP